MSYKESEDSWLDPKAVPCGWGSLGIFWRISAVVDFRLKDYEFPYFEPGCVLNFLRILIVPQIFNDN